MKHLPIAFAVLIVFMALFFNLERLDYVSQSSINISGYVYVLTTVVVVALIVIPLLRQLSFYLVVSAIAVIYLLLKIFVLSPETYWGGDYSYGTITELTLVCVATILARYVGGWIEDFVNAVENITFSRLKRVRTFEETGEEIESEMYRSRRYQHPLAVIVAKPDVDSLRMAIHRTVEEVQRAMLVRYVSISLMTRALYGQLRRTDWLLEQNDKHQYVFVLPETRGERAGIVVERVQKTAEELGVLVSCGVATFPDDALTFDSLLEKAEERLSPLPPPPPAAELHA